MPNKKRESQANINSDGIHLLVLRSQFRERNEIMVWKVNGCAWEISVKSQIQQEKEIRKERKFGRWENSEQANEGFMKITYWNSWVRG